MLYVMALGVPLADFSYMLLLLLGAIACESITGAVPVPRWLLSHPVVIMGRGVSFFDTRLNRSERSAWVRTVRGGVVVVVLCLLAAAVGMGADMLLRVHPWGWVVAFLLVYALLSGRELANAVRRVADAEKNHGVEAARGAVSHIVGRDPAHLDAYGVMRAAIESLSENFSDGVVAPIFWYVLFGIPGLVVYKMINTLDSMIGYKTPHYKAFGYMAARLDDGVNYLPARLSGVCLLVGGLFGTHVAPLHRMFRIMYADAPRHRSPNAGWPEAAMAAVLGIRLAGTRHYATHTVQDEWIGRGTTQVTRHHVYHALRVYRVATAVLITVLLVVLWAVL